MERKKKKEADDGDDNKKYLTVDTRWIFRDEESHTIQRTFTWGNMNRLPTVCISIHRFILNVHRYSVFQQHIHSFFEEEKDNSIKNRMNGIDLKIYYSLKSEMNAIASMPYLQRNLGPLLYVE